MITKFNSNDKVLVLDFDHTCYDTDAFVWFELKQGMVARFNIPVIAWEEGYKNAASIGYTLAEHLNQITKIMGSSPCTLEEIQSFGEHISFEKYLYPDTLVLLKEAKEKNYRIMILSFGAVSWQDRKIKQVGLDKIVDVVEYVTVNENITKTEKIKQYAENCEKIIFVDNKGSNLDAVCESMPEVETYIISRMSLDGRYVGQDANVYLEYLKQRREAEAQSLPVHKRISNFSEIIL